ncbi:hypothetical protein SAMN04489760_111100 [Syntrophus gentianae]|uniref:Uncharacterized protein n=1 Tax=Syntrophus gentianae TaxID=43775 RepID=A0A1H7XPS1_9BACT|nr:hypothetical protein SAMN04489760_111100 [Syntrophus gentianae]
MLLKLAAEQRDYVKITFNTDRFVAEMGEDNPVVREYLSVQEMLQEFEENGIESADFDTQSHEIYKKLLERAYSLGEVLS